MEEALIGLVGLLIGVLLTEYYRRRSRIENYSSRVFDRRLEVYEGFLQQLHESATVVRNVFEASASEAEDAQSIILAANIKLMEYCDKHRLFLNEEITVHCGASFSGALEIPGLSGEDREPYVSRFNQEIRNAERMVLAESGVDEMNALFRSITKAKHNSEIIEYLREKRKEQIKNEHAGKA